MRYCVYILTNHNKTVLYTGVTNDLPKRLTEHRRSDSKSFTGRYAVHYLVYFEEYGDVKVAISREKEIKNMSRARKDSLITDFNPSWRFLGEEE